MEEKQGFCRIKLEGNFKQSRSPRPWRPRWCRRFVFGVTRNDRCRGANIFRILMGADALCPFSISSSRADEECWWELSPLAAGERFARARVFFRSSIPGKGNILGSAAHFLRKSPCDFSGSPFGISYWTEVMTHVLVRWLSGWKHSPYWRRTRVQVPVPL